MISKHCGKSLVRTSPDATSAYAPSAHRWKCKVCGRIFKQKRRISNEKRDLSKALMKSGKRVGMVWVGADSCTFFCHICRKDQTLPAFDSNPIDEIKDCPGCQTPFVFSAV